MNSLAGATAANFTYQIFQVMSNELGTPKIVMCPSDADRTARDNFGAAFGNNASVSYFVGKDADETNPQYVLSGDRNIGLKPAGGWAGVGGASQTGGVTGMSPNGATTGNYFSLAPFTNNVALQWTDKLHQANGNIGLADGSVQQPSSSKMRDFFKSANDPILGTYFP
jgi:hypothetical protein